MKKFILFCLLIMLCFLSYGQLNKTVKELRADSVTERVTGSGVKIKNANIDATTSTINDTNFVQYLQLHGGNGDAKKLTIKNLNGTPIDCNSPIITFEAYFTDSTGPVYANYNATRAGNPTGYLNSANFLFVDTFYISKDINGTVYYSDMYILTEDRTTPPVPVFDTINISTGLIMVTVSLGSSDLSDTPHNYIWGSVSDVTSTSPTIITRDFTGSVTVYNARNGCTSTDAYSY